MKCARYSGDLTDEQVCWKWGHSGRDEKGEVGESQKSQLGKDLNLRAQQSSLESIWATEGISIGGYHTLGTCLAKLDKESEAQEMKQYQAHLAGHLRLNLSC